MSESVMVTEEEGQHLETQLGETIEPRCRDLINDVSTLSHVSHPLETPKSKNVESLMWVQAWLIWFGRGHCGCAVSARLPGCTVTLHTEEDPEGNWRFSTNQVQIRPCYVTASDLMAPSFPFTLLWG